MTKEDKEKAIRELKILKENYWDDDGYGHETEQYEDAMFALDMGIEAIEQWSIPKGATNGDIIMAMFNCTVIGVSKGKVYVEHIYFPFDEGWWNAPYRECEEKKMAHNKLESYVSPEDEYIIPVTYEMYSTVRVAGTKNLKEAIELVEKNIDDIPLGQGEYIDGSYKIAIDDDDEAIAAQDYVHIGEVEISPEDFSS